MPSFAAMSTVDVWTVLHRAFKSLVVAKAIPRFATNERSMNALWTPKEPYGRVARNARHGFLVAS